jgi:hypothetical protein
MIGAIYLKLASELKRIKKQYCVAIVCLRKNILALWIQPATQLFDKRYGYQKN